MKRLKVVLIIILVFMLIPFASALDKGDLMLFENANASIFDKIHFPSRKLKLDQYVVFVDGPKKSPKKKLGTVEFKKGQKIEDVMTFKRYLNEGYSFSTLPHYTTTLSKSTEVVAYYTLVKANVKIFVEQDNRLTTVFGRRVSHGQTWPATARICPNGDTPKGVSYTRGGRVYDLPTIFNFNTYPPKTSYYLQCKGGAGGDSNESNNSSRTVQISYKYRNPENRQVVLLKKIDIPYNTTVDEEETPTSIPGFENYAVSDDFDYNKKITKNTDIFLTLTQIDIKLTVKSKYFPKRFSY